MSPVERDGTSPRARLSWLSATLNVQDESQDWGIINADASRLDEFTEFLADTRLAPTEVFEMIELIIASANEKLLADPGVGLDPVADVLREHRTAATVHVDYWRSLDDETAYPIAGWLRSHGGF